jgi:hypothetical protein
VTLSEPPYDPAFPFPVLDACATQPGGKLLPVQPFGIPSAHTWPQIGFLFTLMDELKWRAFVEIGVMNGGLADLMLRRQDIVGDIRYLGVEVNKAGVRPRILERPEIIIGNCFEHIGTIQNFIGSHPRPAVIYCDGGNKPQEMRTFSQVLREGDFLLAHDYPGETSPEFLAVFAMERPCMTEWEPRITRAHGMSLWQAHRPEEQA